MIPVPIPIIILAAFLCLHFFGAVPYCIAVYFVTGCVIIPMFSDEMCEVLTAKHLTRCRLVASLCVMSSCLLDMALPIIAMVVTGIGLFVMTHNKERFPELSSKP